MKLKNFLVGMVGAVSLLGTSQAFAWDVNSVQRGWVDSIGTVQYTGAVFGPSTPMSIRGWACVRPDLYGYGVPSTQISVTYNGVSQPLLANKYEEERADLVAYNVCGGYGRGFIVWISKPTTYQAYYQIAFQGPYETTVLEGQNYY